MGPLIPQFWTSGDVFSVFQSQRGVRVTRVHGVELSFTRCIDQYVPLSPHPDMYNPVILRRVL